MNGRVIWGDERMECEVEDGSNLIDEYRIKKEVGAVSGSSE